MLALLSVLTTVARGTAAGGASWTAPGSAASAVEMTTLDVEVVGAGTVTGSGGLACTASGTGCAATFPHGTVESLTPAPAPGFVFTGWGKSCRGTGACRLVMTTDRLVTATFQPVFGAAVTLQGAAVTSSSRVTGKGISCRGPGARTSDCSQEYLGGTRVRFSRSAPPRGRTFRWLGDCAFRGSNSSCTLTMDADRSVVADYSLTQLDLTVNVTGPGRVTGVGAGIDCTGLSCLAVVDYGTAVQLSAIPGSAPAGEFLGWTGCPTAVGGTICAFSATATRAVTASFGPAVTSLTVVPAGGNDDVPLAQGARRQYSAIATFADGSRRDVTAESRWVSANTAVARVDGDTGLVTGGSPGTAAIIATFQTAGGSTAEGSASVVTDVVSAVTVACFPYNDPGGSLACLPEGLGYEVECRAMATFAGGAAHDVTDQAVWRSTSTSIARSLGLSQFGDDPVVASFRLDSAGTAAIVATVGRVTSSKDKSPGSGWVIETARLAVVTVSVAGPTGPVAAGSLVPLQALARFTPVATDAGGCPAAPDAPPARDFSLLTRWDTAPADSPVASVNVLGEVETLAPGQVAITWRYQDPVDGTPVFSGAVPITVP